MTRFDSLYQLLVSLSGDAGDLLRLLAQLGFDRATLAELPPDTAPLADVAAKAVDALDRRSLVDGTLFDRLVGQFPGRAGDIAVVRALWGASPTPVLGEPLGEPDVPLVAPATSPRLWVGANGRLPLVLVPGFAGSVLRKDRQLWPPLDLLDLPRLGALVRDDEAKPDGLVMDWGVLTSLPGGERLGSWTTFVDDVLEGRLGYRRGVDLELFAYDWRVDPRRSAAALAERLEAFVERLSAGGTPVRVALVAHSMGAYVARWCVDHLGGARYVERMLLLGPADRGSTNAFASLLSGRFHFDATGPVAPSLAERAAIEGVGGLRTVRRLVSLAMLVPVEPVVYDTEGEPIDPRADTSWLDEGDDLEAWLHAGAGALEELRRPPTVPTTYVYGKGAASPARVVVPRSSATGRPDWSAAVVETVPGDGVVAAVDARPGDAAARVDTVWVEAAHGTVFLHPEVQRLLTTTVEAPLTLEEALAPADLPVGRVRDYLEELLADRRYRDASEAGLSPLVALDPPLPGRPPEDFAAALLGAHPARPLCVHGWDPMAGPPCVLWARRRAGLDPLQSLPLPVYAGLDGPLAASVLGGLRGLSDLADRLLGAVPSLLVVEGLSDRLHRDEQGTASELAELRKRWPQARFLLLDADGQARLEAPGLLRYRVVLPPSGAAREAEIFSREDIEILFRTAHDAGLRAPGLQDALARSLPPAVARSLPSPADPSERLRETMLWLNRITAAGGGPLPLRLWLDAAAPYVEWMGDSPLARARARLAAQ